MNALLTTEKPPVLVGPDGGSLLGFLCALGTLATLQRAYPNETVRLAWALTGGWRPQVSIGDRFVAKTDVAVLFKELTSDANRARFSLRAHPHVKGVKSLSDDGCYLNPNHVPAWDYATIAKSLRERVNPIQRAACDFIAAIGGLVNTDETAAVEPTALCALGASQQYFFKTARELSQTPGQPISKKGKSRAPRNLDEDPGTADDHLAAALFQPWTYSHPAPGMRWDSAEDRNHALRWRDPSPDAIWTERGANRLAIEALGFLPTAPTTRALQTCGFGEHQGRTFFSWPIWTASLSRHAVKTLVSHAEITREEPRRSLLAPLSVEEVFRCERLQKSKQVNFSVAIPILH